MNEIFSSEDIKENKLKAGLGYLVFFLPLILCKDSKLGKHCANQGLLLLIVNVLVTILFGIFSGLPLLGWLIRLVGNLVRFALLLVALVCFLQLTTNDRVVEIPYIGGIRILS